MWGLKLLLYNFSHKPKYSMALYVLSYKLIIWAGLQWMTAQGNSSQVDKAKDLMINAVIGLIIFLPKIVPVTTVPIPFGEKTLST